MDSGIITALALMGNALILGFRHGIDWDHVAAIADIVGTTCGNQKPFCHCSKQLQFKAVGMSSYYALGHGAIVVALGIMAMYFSATLPQWLDNFMQRLVGLTLIVFSIYIFYSLTRFCLAKEEFRFNSRWMIIFSALQQLFSKITSSPKKTAPRQYGPRTAFFVGSLHGIGAETGTQVLLLASLAGVTKHALGVGLLLAFASGCLVSNTVIAILSSKGFVSSANIKVAYACLGTITGIFSAAIGLMFTFGQADHLPDLQKLIAATGW